MAATSPSPASEPLRVEDPPLLRGEARFVADLDLPGVAVAHYVTATMAHAAIRSIDVTEAAAHPGVLAVVTGADLDAAGRRPTMPGHPPDYPKGTVRPVLARDRVRFVGEAVVAIVAETEAVAADAAELVVVDLEPLDAVVGIEAAESATDLFPDAPGNVAATATGGDDEPPSFDGLDVVVELEILNQRLAPAPMETRVAAAEWVDGRLVHHASCQGAHPIRAALAAWYGLETDEVRVVTRDVGGSFGAKGRFYVEDLLLGHLAALVGRPVRWTPTRSADMVGLGHSRAQRQRVRIGGDADGRIRALQADVTVDAGAYPVAGFHLGRNTGTMLPGPYGIDAVHWTVKAVLTNTTPIVAYRGAGRPESGALLDRAVDAFAAEAGLDPIEVRRRNLIPPERLPFHNPSGVIYDSGDFPQAFELALAEVGAPELRRDQAARRERGDRIQRGLGLSVFIDRTAGIPSSEYGRVELRDGGGIRVFTGSSPYGQGHHTTWAQLVADRTGVPFAEIEVVHGDTDVVPRGGITGGSRSAQLAGSAVALSAEQLVDLARARAADLLEAATADVVLDVGQGRFHVAGAPAATTVGWAEVAASVLVDGGEPSLDEETIAFACETDYTADGHTVPYGAYAAVVDVDTETGGIELVRLVSVDDAGAIINRAIVVGQVHGGVGQAIGQALWEEFVYDESGNPLTSTFLDYGIPSAAEMPSFEAHLTEHPSPNNPLGAKGIAESGTIGAVPAVQNAVIDALAHLGVTHLDLPVTPRRVWNALRH